MQEPDKKYKIIMIDLDNTLIQNTRILTLLHNKITNKYFPIEKNNNMNISATVINKLKNKGCKTFFYEYIHSSENSDEVSMLQMYEFLLFSSDKITSIFKTAAEKEIPIIILTHAKYPFVILVKIMEKLTLGNNCQFEEKEQSLEYDDMQYSIKYGFFKHNNKKGIIYFFNRLDVNSDLFHYIRDNLKFLKENNEQFKYTPDTSSSLDESRKPINMLCCFEIINKVGSKLYNSHEHINFVLPEHRKSIIVMDDRKSCIKLAKGLQIEAIHSLIETHNIHLSYSDKHLTELQQKLKCGMEEKNNQIHHHIPKRINPDNNRLFHSNHPRRSNSKSNVCCGKNSNLKDSKKIKRENLFCSIL